MDNKSVEQRSANMALIRSKNTTPEIFVRKLIFGLGFRYRLYNKKLPGTPDLYLKKYNTAVFVHGCFWHGHKNCSKSRLPSTHTEFWVEKITRNRKRDRDVVKELLGKGIRVLVIWQCACKKRNAEDLSRKINNFIVGDCSYLEIELPNFSEYSSKGNQSHGKEQ